MKIVVKFRCGEIVGEMPSGEYEVPDGADVGAALASLAARSGGFLRNYEDYLLYLVNSLPARPETPLHTGDTLRVLRKAVGG